MTATGRPWCATASGSSANIVAPNWRPSTGYQRAADLFGEVGDQCAEADALASIGDCHAAAGDIQAARSHWYSAIVIYDELHHPRGFQLRTKLSGANSDHSAGT
jgi:hypothetical protein